MSCSERSKVRDIFKITFAFITLQCERAGVCMDHHSCAIATGRKWMQAIMFVGWVWYSIPFHFNPIQLLHDSYASKWWCPRWAVQIEEFGGIVYSCGTTRKWFNKNLKNKGEKRAAKKPKRERSEWIKKQYQRQEKKDEEMLKEN